jgi:hypothetical protein
MVARRLSWLGAAVVVACTRAGPREPRPPEERRDRVVATDQQAHLEALSARADAAPDDFAAQKAAGLGHMWAALSGVLSSQAPAEHYLEAAFALDPTDRELTRSLGRFYNMRAVDGDDSKADRQVEVYRAHLRGQDPREMSSIDFVAYTFSRLGEILVLRQRGKLLKALGTVSEFEAELRERTERFPDDIEMFALAGNFAFFFAGNVPFERERRVREAVAYFEVLRGRWSELRAGARDETHCPNTYENFMFELAEGYLVLRRPEKARPIYEELSRPREPVTRPRQQIAEISAERLARVDKYLGDLELMPPWPGDVANCIVCHAWTAEVSTRSLHRQD